MSGQEKFVESKSDIYLSLIVPISNSREYLPLSLEEIRAFLSSIKLGWELILVDDGSADDSFAIVQDFAQRVGDGKVVLLRNEENRGKGFSVRRGTMTARGRFLVFTDADLAYPASEIGKILKELENGSDVAIACRVLPESRYLISPSFFNYLYTRHILGRLFNLIVRMVFLPGIVDTQAGLKGFRKDAAEIIFGRQRIDRFGFDVELLLIAKRHGLRTKEVAVQFRYFQEPTTIRFIQDAINILKDLTRIKINDFKRFYR